MTEFSVAEEAVRRGQSALDERAARRSGGTTTGEKGEKGENPHGSRDGDGRTKGESGRKRANEGAKGGDFSPEQAKARAARTLGGTAFTPPEYPAQALGECLAPAAAAIAEEGQLSLAMVGQSLLGAAALLAQGRNNVRTLAGIKPLSLFLLTIGESGDGKSTADGAALTPVRGWQREKAKVYEADLARHDAEQAATKRGDPPPAPPLAPWALMRDATVEGIRAGFQHGRSSQGVFTAEAGAMLAGYGMSKDNRQKTCATFNELWDDGEISVSRSMAGRIQLYGKRLSAHWLVQPDAAREALSDPLLSSMGFWPRFLLAWPEPAPARLARPFDPHKSPTIARAWTRFTELLRDPVPDDCTNLPAIAFTDEALAAILHPAFERFEREAKTDGGAFAHIRPFALRATEQVCRVAGVLAVVDGAQSVDVDAARRALALAAYSIETWRTLAGDRESSEVKQWALCLFNWIADHGGSATESAMLRLGPKRFSLRSASRRDAALAVLELHGLVQRRGATWSTTP